MRAISDPPFFQSFTVSQAWSTRYPRLCRFITREKIDVNIWNWRVAARGRGGHNFIASFYDLWESCVLLCVYATLEPSPARGEPCSSSFPLSQPENFPLSPSRASPSNSTHPSAFYKHHDMKPSPDFYASQPFRIWCALEKFPTRTFFFSYQTFAYIHVDGVFTIFVKASYRDERERRKVGGGSMKGRKSKRRRIRLVRFRVGGK